MENARSVVDALCANGSVFSGTERLRFVLVGETHDSMSRRIGTEAHPELISLERETSTNVYKFHYIEGVPDTVPRISATILYIRYLIINADVESLLAQDVRPHQVSRALIEARDVPILSDVVAFGRAVGNKSTVLIPDLYYFETLGFRERWFSDGFVSWSERADSFIWRGSTTGDLNITEQSIYDLPRYLLCKKANQMGSHVDCAITNIVQCADAHSEVSILQLFKDMELLKPRMTQSEMARSKFQIEIDGNSNSWGFFPKLLAGSCVLKVDSEFEQWFYPDITPWVHYVPVSKDQSDLGDQIDWCLANPERCAQIAANAKAFAELCSFENAMKAASGRLIEVLARDQLPSI